MCTQAVLWCHHPRGWRTCKLKNSEWKSTLRVRTVPFPWQTSCLCQVLEVLSSSPPAQSYSRESAPACWGRGNINIIKIIREVFYKPLCILCVRLGGKGGAWLALQGNTFQSVLQFVTEVGMLWVLLCFAVLPLGVTPKHRGSLEVSPWNALKRRQNNNNKKSFSLGRLVGTCPWLSSKITRWGWAALHSACFLSGRNFYLLMINSNISCHEYSLHRVINLWWVRGGGGSVLTISLSHRLCFHWHFHSINLDLVN